MHHIVGLMPYQIAAEKLIARLTATYGIRGFDIKAMFQDIRGQQWMGFKPRRLDTGEEILEVVRFSSRGRYNSILVSCPIPKSAGPEEENVIKQIFVECGALWCTHQEVADPYKPDFKPPEWLVAEAAGMLAWDLKY